MDMITSHTHYTELIQYEGGNKMDNLKKSHSYLMREGFAVMVTRTKDSGEQLLCLADG